MTEKLISQSPTIVKVGESIFEIYRNVSFDTPIIQMIGSIKIQDPATGVVEEFRTSTPGWEWKKIKEENSFENDSEF